MSHGTSKHFPSLALMLILIAALSGCVQNPAIQINSDTYAHKGDFMRITTQDDVLHEFIFQRLEHNALVGGDDEQVQLSNVKLIEVFRPGQLINKHRFADAESMTARLHEAQSKSEAVRVLMHNHAPVERVLACKLLGTQMQLTLMGSKLADNPQKWEEYEVQQTVDVNDIEVFRIARWAYAVEEQGAEYWHPFADVIGLGAQIEKYLNADLGAALFGSDKRLSWMSVRLRDGQIVESRFTRIEDNQLIGEDATVALDIISLIYYYSTHNPKNEPRAASPLSELPMLFGGAIGKP